MQTTTLSFWQKRPLLCAVGLIITFSCVRLWIAGSGQLDLAQDEAQYWDWSRRLQLSYYSKGPLIAWLIRFGTTLFGNTELGVRFAAVLCNVAIQGLLVVWIGRIFARPLLALIVICLANTIPLFIASGVLMTTDNPLMVCWVLGFVSVSALVEKQTSKLALVGLFAAVAFGVLAKYTMLLFVPLALLYVWILVRLGLVARATLTRAAVALLLGAFIGFLPILIWNMQNDFVSFRHVARLAGVSHGPAETPPLIRFDRLPEYAGSQFGLLLPWWLCIMVWQGWHMLDACITRIKAGKQGPAFTLHTYNEATGITTAQGAGVQQKHFTLNLLLCIGFWPIWLFFMVWSLHTRVYPNWSATCYVAGVVIVGLGIERLLASGAAAVKQSALGGAGQPPQKRLWSGARWLPVWVCLSVLVSAGIHGQYYISQWLPLPAKYNPTVRLKGWSSLGERLEAIRLSMPNPDKVFFFSDAYDVTAALAFYAPNQPFTYCSDFGRRLSQYDLWQDPNGETVLSIMRDKAAGIPQVAAKDSPHYGWSAVFVSRKPLRKVPSELQGMFTTIGPIENFASQHLGENGREFGIIPVYNFTGQWLRPSQGIY